MDQDEPKLQVRLTIEDLPCLLVDVRPATARQVEVESSIRVDVK